MVCTLSASGTDVQSCHNFCVRVVAMEETYSSLFEAVDAFHNEWFPDPVKVQPYWFGAQKPSFRDYFERLALRFEAPLVAVAEGQFRLISMGSCGVFLGRPSRAVCLLRIKTAVFLDQMSRNLVRARCSSTDCASLQQACDAVALPLALSVLADVGESNDGKGFLAIASPVECCFLSLVLRHTRLPVFVGIAEGMLRAVLATLTDTSCSQFCSEPEMAISLCERFLSETRDVADAIPVENYLRRALTGDQPVLLEGLASVPPRSCVLDACCRKWPESTFLSPLLRNGDASNLKAHRALSVLRDSLADLGFLSSRRGLVLSLSGGVDSMVTCCLLWLLQHDLRPMDRFQWCALHLCHPNRADALDEEGWVQWLCSQLGVDLYTYRSQRIRQAHQCSVC